MPSIVHESNYSLHDPYFPDMFVFKRVYFCFRNRSLNRVAVGTPHWDVAAAESLRSLDKRNKLHQNKNEIQKMLRSKTLNGVDVVVVVEAAAVVLGGVVLALEAVEAVVVATAVVVVGIAIGVVTLDMVIGLTTAMDAVDVVDVGMVVDMVDPDLEDAEVVVVAGVAMAVVAVVVDGFDQSCLRTKTPIRNRQISSSKIRLKKPKTTIHHHLQKPKMSKATNVGDRVERLVVAEVGVD